MRPAIARYLSILGFVLSCVILAFVGATSNHRLAELRDASRSVEHTHEVRTELERILSRLTDAETSQRGFLCSWGGCKFREGLLRQEGFVPPMLCEKVSLGTTEADRTDRNAVSH